MANRVTQERRRRKEAVAVAVAVPQSIFLPPTEDVGGYIFMCSSYTLPDSLQLQIFGLPDYYRDSVRGIRPETPLFLYNYSNGRLHGIFEAASFGGFNLDPSAWPDINYPGRSFYPAQVHVRWRRECRPLGWEMSRNILHILSVGDDRFRVELRRGEAERIMELFD